MSSPSPSPSPSDYESADSQQEQERPNRWQGTAKTWQNITASDRAVAASLDLARDRDLSVHLYNAWELKRKGRERRSKEREGDGEAKKEEEVRDKDWASELEDTKGFVPPRSWVAWPLRQEDVPRDVAWDTGEEDKRDGLEEWTYKRRNDGERTSGEVLEDVLVARTLRFAKERFEKRMREDDDEEEEQHGNGGRVGELQGDLVESRNATPITQQEEEEVQEDFLSQSRKRSKKSSRKHDLPEMVPVVSIDDDRSRELLRPSIRSTLAKLDDILLALHHARSTCLQVARESSDSEAEEPTNEEEMVTSKRPQGRPRNSEVGAFVPTAADILLSLKKTKRGRPKKEYPRLPGETDNDYVVRIARIRKIALPAFAPPRDGPSPSAEPSTPRKPKSPPATRLTGEALTARRVRRLELRDWSEVLGTAALVGFDSDVVKRATQRCANLFGEGMSINTIVEAPFGESKDVLSTYKPDLFQAFDLDYPLDYKDVLQSEDEVSEDEVTPETNSTLRSSATPARTSLEPLAPRKDTNPRHFCTVEGCPRAKNSFRDGTDLTRHLFEVHRIGSLRNNNHNQSFRTHCARSPGSDIKTLLCPVDDCRRSGKPFKNNFSLRRHLRRAHEIYDDNGANEAEENFLASDEEMDGGVHVDGFLRPFNYALKHVQPDMKPPRPKRMATRTRVVPEDEDVESGDDGGDHGEQSWSRDTAQASQ